MNQATSGSRSSLSRWFPTRPSSSRNVYELPVWKFSRTNTLAKESMQTSTRLPSPYPSHPNNENLAVPPTLPTSPKPPSRTTAWLQVLVGHLVILNSFGLIQSFGIFQPRYETLLSSTPSQVAWIGSIHIFFVFFLGTFSGYLLDRGYYRECLGIGSALQVTGLLVAGFSRTWWMTFIFHGVFQGVGHGLMFCPAVTMTAVYFEGRGMKTTAMSLAGCGGAMGGILFPAIAKYTVDTRGIACTLWIMCGVVSATSALIQIFAQPKLPSSPQLTTTKLQASCLKTIKEKIRSLVDWRAFSDPGFSLYVLAMFCVFAGLWIPYFYIHAFSAKALHLTKSQSFTMLLALNGAGIPGRIVPALLSDYCLGTVNTHILLLLLTSATLICWPFITSPTGMVLWALAYGFCAGGVASLLQAGIASLNSEPRKTGSKIGMAFSVVAFASLLGVPVGGELIRMGRRDRGMGIEGFVYLQVFTGGVMLVGCGVLIAARIEKTGWRVGVKV